MIPEQPAEEELSFGEKLLGLQGFSTVRAKRYREELDQLLVHRISTFERWSMAFSSLLFAATLIIGGVSIAFAKGTPMYGVASFDQARTVFAFTCALTGLLLGGWLLHIAIQAGYSRRVGDWIGILIALASCGGWGFAVIDMAWVTDDASLRMKLLLAGGALFAILVACVILACIQRLHRQTQEKLLRIEYHLAELMDRNTPPTPS
jgi:hypothetical protein